MEKIFCNLLKLHMLSGFRTLRIETKKSSIESRSESKAFGSFQVASLFPDFLLELRHWLKNHKSSDTKAHHSTSFVPFE